jgi:hypothetical protein
MRNGRNGGAWMAGGGLLVYILVPLICIMQLELKVTQFEFELK